MIGYIFAAVIGYFCSIVALLSGLYGFYEGFSEPVQRDQWKAFDTGAKCIIASALIALLTAWVTGI